MCDYKNEEKKLTQKEIDWNKSRLEDRTMVIFVDGIKKVI